LLSSKDNGSGTPSLETTLATNRFGSFMRQLFSVASLTILFWVKSILAVLGFLGFFFSRFGAFLLPISE
jgi:hypothetical protein